MKIRKLENGYLLEVDCTIKNSHLTYRGPEFFFDPTLEESLARMVRYLEGREASVEVRWA